MPSSSNPTDEPWLYAEVHKAVSLDDVLQATFGLGGLPNSNNQSSRDKLARISNIVLGFRAFYVHLFQHALDMNKRKKLSEAQLSAWDLADEAVQELVVASLLVRLRASSQAVSHLRRCLELVVEGSFLSTSFIPIESGEWSPFCEIYLTDLWQHYASTSSLTAREVIQAIRTEGGVVSKELAGFTTSYLKKYATPYCEKHLQAIIGKHKRRHLSEPVWYDELPRMGKCQSDSCTESAAHVVVERTPNFELMREVSKAKLANVGYSNSDDGVLRLLYGKTSGFVHVTREAHRHQPEWSITALQGSVSLMKDLSVWLARTIICLYRWHGMELSGCLNILRESDTIFSRRHRGACSKPRAASTVLESRNFVPSDLHSLPGRSSGVRDRNSRID